MRRLIPSGVWEIFVPDLADGACYKYEVRTTAGHLLEKDDPYAQRFEVPPNTASIIWTGGQYQWRDGDWIRDRPSFDGWHERPMSIYEVHLGSWRRVPEEGGRNHGPRRREAQGCGAAASRPRPESGGNEARAHGVRPKPPLAPQPPAPRPAETCRPLPRARESPTSTSSWRARRGRSGGERSSTA